MGVASRLRALRAPGSQHHAAGRLGLCGRADPIDLLPDDLDFVFIATGSQGSALAYALARLYRQRRVRTVIAGPHAAAFPRDCARFFDVTVPRCDRALLAEILSLDPRPGTILTSTRPPADAPCIEERLPELEASVLARGRRGIATVIPLRATSHWPSDGDTSGCRPAATLAADLTFVAKAFPGAVLGFQDEDFGLHLDETLDRLEAVPPARRSRYLVQCSLDALTTERRRAARDDGLPPSHGRDAWPRQIPGSRASEPPGGGPRGASSSRAGPGSEYRARPRR
jgi:hypothetical protein